MDADPLTSAASVAPASAQRPVSGAFMGGYVIAQIGAYISFLPLLQILTPLQAAVLAPGHKAELLSQIASLGAVAAAASNLLAGWASDRTRTRWGRRRPWIVLGAVATALSYGFVAAARTPADLLGAILLFQVAFNCAFAPLVALIPDRVPDRQKGWVSALTGLGLPFGSVIGAWVVGVIVLDNQTRFAVLGGMVLIAMLPFALTIREPPLAPRVVGQTVRRSRTPFQWPGFSADFFYVWMGRCLVQTAFSLVQIYLLFYLQESLVYGAARAGRPEGDMARLAAVFALANIAAGLAAGRASDRLGRRKPFVIGGALLMAASILGLATATSWPLVAASYAALGVGAGCYFAVDLALIAQVLPSGRTAGRDLGIVNLSLTIPQVAAPALAALMLAMPGAGFRWVFAAAAGLGVLGAAMVAPVRGIR